MKRLILLCALVLIACGSSNAADTAGDLKPIFNGMDLSGWTTKAPDQWKVENGVLIGHQDDPKGKGSMLYTRQSYKDVIVEADVRFGDNIDSGFMLRKPEIQLQIGVSRSLKKDMTGSIYAHGKYPEDARARDAEKLLKLNDWNTLRFQARGDTFDVWLNGQHVLTYKDTAFPGAAPIGLQIHPGVKMKVEFRNIRAKSLDTASASAR